MVSFFEGRLDMLSKEAIQQYQTIYKDLYGEDISEEKALETGTRLIELFKILLNCGDGNQISNGDHSLKQESVIPGRDHV